MKHLYIVVIMTILLFYSNIVTISIIIIIIQYLKIVDKMHTILLVPLSGPYLKFYFSIFI